MRPAGGRNASLDHRKGGQEPKPKGYSGPFPVVLLREEKHPGQGPTTALISSTCFCLQLGPVPESQMKTAKHSPLLNISPSPCAPGLDTCCKEATLNRNGQCSPHPDPPFTQRVSRNPPSASWSTCWYYLLVTNEETVTQRGAVTHPWPASPAEQGLRCGPRYSNSRPICSASTPHSFSGRNEA